MSMGYYDVSFFFQAEDGIRDGTVTGVQTCALPISRIRSVDCLQVPGRSVEQRARHEADGRHRGVQEIAQHVDQDAPHGDVTAETLEQVRAVAQPLDHRVELILARGDFHWPAHSPGRTGLTRGQVKKSSAAGRRDAWCVCGAGSSSAALSSASARRWS